MRYTTINEFDNFEFKDVHISDIQFRDGSFNITLDDVVILPENSCNRDIRKMRCNALKLTLEDPELDSFIQEGIKIYDADGNFKEQIDDKPVEKEAYDETRKAFIEGYAYEITKKDNVYSFVIDSTDEKTYNLVIKGKGDVEEWDKFLNLE